MKKQISIYAVITLILLAFRIDAQTSSSCANADFEYNSFVNWVGYTGSCCPVVMTATGINSSGTPGDVYPQHFITSVFGNDPNTPNPGSLPVAGVEIPYVAPNGGIHSVRLGNSGVNFHAEKLTYSMNVTSGNDLFYYWYALVLEDAGHIPSEQPGFEVIITDSGGNQLGGTCGQYLVVASPNNPGFYTSSYNSNYRCKDWTLVGVDLSPYIGQIIKVSFTTNDCGYGNHFGYAYLEAGCAPLSINMAYCAGTTTASASAPSGFLYSWTGPGIITPVTAQTINIPAITPGAVYNCVCTSFNGCSVTLTSTAIATQVTANYSYSSRCRKITFHDLSTIAGPGNINQWYWDFGDGNSSTSQNPSHVYNTPGAYTITLTSTADNGCSGNYSATINVIATDPNFLNITATPSPSGVCLNFSSVITAQPGPSGVSGVSYSWTGPNGYTSLHDTITVSPSTTSSYFLTAQDSFCIAYDTATVTVHPTPVPSASSNSPQCVGGTLNLTALGAGNGGAYTWSGPNSFSSTLQNPVLPGVSLAAGGQYSVTVTDTYGCTAVATTQVTISSSPTITVTNNGPHCAGIPLSLNATGGSTYSWSGPNGFTSTLSNPVITITTVSTTGTYSVTVTSSGGCSAVGTTTATINAQPMAPIISSNSPLCEYNTLSLQATSSSGASYLWSGPNAFSSTSQTPSIVNPVSNLATGTYYVTATIAGCTSTSNAAVLVQATPSSTFSLTPSICQYQTALLNYTGAGQSGVSYSYNITGIYTPYPLGNGPGPFNVQWSSPGVYTVTLTVTYNTAPSCTSTTSHQVNVVANSVIGCCTTPTPTAGPNASICGLSYTLQGSLPFAGNTGTWTQVSGPGSSVFTNNTSNVSNVSVTAAGQYVFRWTETSGSCVGSSQVQITFVNQPVADAGFDNDTCGLLYHLHAVPSYGNGHWSGNGSFGNPNSASTSVTSLAGYGIIPFIWTETNTSGSLVCQDADTVNIHFYQVPTPSAGSNFSVCGLNAILDAQPVSPGNTGQWSQVSGGGLSTFSDYTSDSSYVSVTSAGVYQYRWTETNGICSASSDVTITYVPYPVANAGINADTCGKTFVLNAQPGTGTGAWSGNATFNPANTPQTNATVLNYGLYTFYWTETNIAGNSHCSSADSVMINYHEIPVPDAGINDNGCGSSYRLNADTLFPGYWTGPSGAIYDNSPSGIYHPHAAVSVPSYPPVFIRQYTFYWHETNSYSGGTCTAEDSVNITFYLPPHAEAGVDSTTCGTAGYLLHADTLGAGATGGYWTSKVPGVLFSSDTVLAPHISIANNIPAIYGDSSRVTIWFYWTVHNSPSCTGTDSAKITFYQSPVANAGADDSTCGKNILIYAHNSMGVSSGSWGQVSGPGVTNFLIPTEQVTQAIVNSYGTYYYLWREINPFNTLCQSSDTVRIIYLAIPNPDAGPDTSVCGKFVNLHAIAGPGDHGIWSSNPAGTSWWNQTRDTTGSYYATKPNTWARFSSSNDTVEYIWQEYNSICVARDSMYVYFASLQNAISLVNAADSITCGLSFTRLNAQEPQYGIGYWIDTVPNTHYFPGPTPGPINASPDSEVAAVYGMHHFYWVTRNGACIDTSSVIPVRFIQKPYANSGGHNWHGANGSQIKTDTVCGNIYYLNAIPSIGSGLWISQDPLHTWFNQHGPGVQTSSRPDDTVNTSILTYNTNPPYSQLIWTEDNDGCNDSDTLRLMFAPIPNGNFTATMPSCIGDSSIITGKTNPSNTGTYGIVHFYWSLDTTARFESDTTNYIDRDTLVVKLTQGNFHVVKLVTMNKYGCNSGIMTDTVFEPARFNPPYNIDTTTCHQSNGGLTLFTNNHTYTYTWDSTFSISHRHDTIQSNLSNRLYSILVYGPSVSPDAQPGTFCTDTLNLFIPDTGEVTAMFDTAFFADSMYTIAPYTATFINQSAGAAGYTWLFYDKNGNKIGQSNDTNPTFTFQQGVYTIVLVAESKFFCKDTMTFRNLHIRTSVQDNLTDNFNLEIFPDPFEDYFYLNYELNKLSDVKIEILDILGNNIAAVVNSKQMTGKYSYRFERNNPDGIRSGVFIVKLAVNDSIYYRKIIQVK